MEFDEINRILEMVREHELSEFELEREGFKIRIKKGTLVNASGPFAMPMVQQVAPAAPQAPAATPPAPLEAVPSAPLSLVRRGRFRDREIADRRHVLPFGRARGSRHSST